MIQTFTAIARKEDGLCVGECPETGTASQSETIEKALANQKEATELYLLMSAFQMIRKGNAKCPKTGLPLEALRSLAMQASIEEFPLKSLSHPILTTFEVAAHA